MPLITPQNVRDYTVFKPVSDRITTLLDYDIIQAEQDVFAYCGHEFDDITFYPTIPTEVKLALIKLAEYYALVNSDESLAKGYQSEKIGDYTYTLGDGTNFSVRLDKLIGKHVKSGGSNGTKFKLRAF